MPLTDSSSGESSMIRVSFTAPEVSSSPRPMSSPSPGANTGTSQGASASAIRQSTAVARKMIVRTLLAILQAESALSRR